MTSRPHRTCSEAGCTKPVEWSGKGRPPTRCEDHRRTRRHRKGTGRPVRLQVVPDTPPDPASPVADAAEEFLARLDAGEKFLGEVFGLNAPAAPRPARVAEGVAGVLAALDVGHPAGPALRAIAQTLAEAVAHPATQDPRVLVAVTKELRETLRQLTTPVEGGADDDPWGFGDLRPTVGDTPAP